MSRTPFSSRIMAGIVSVSLVAFFFVSFYSANAAPLATTVVTPANPNGWVSGLESGTNGSVSFVSGPAGQPAGTGSARFQTADGATGAILSRNGIYPGLRFDDITTLTYDLYKAAGSSATNDVIFQINVDYNLTDANTAWQGRLVYEPYYAAPLPTGVWNTVNPLTGGEGWWATGAPGNGACPISNPCTWAEVLAAFPNAGVQSGALAAIHFKAGSGWTTPFDGNVDNLHIMADGGIDDTYDFDNSSAGPGPACTTTCYVSTLGSDSNGGATADDPLRNIQTGINTVDAGGTVVVAEGIYFETLTVNKWLTLDGAGSGADPLADTLVLSTNAAADVLTVTTGGSSAVNRTVIRDVRLTRAGAPPASNTGDGLYITAGSFITVDNVAATLNPANGVNVGSGPVNDLRILNSNLSLNYGAGWRSASGTVLDGFLLENSTLANNRSYGILTGGYTHSQFQDNFTLRDVVFTANGNTLAGGNGDLILFFYNGNLTIEDVTINGIAAPATGPNYGMLLIGNSPTAASGTVTIDGLTITGNYRSGVNPGSSAVIQNYGAGSSFTLNDLDIDSGADSNGLVLAGLSDTIDLGNANFDGALQVIRLSGTSYNPTGASNTTATGITVNGVAVATATLPQLFDIENRIRHRIDIGTPINVNQAVGLVRVRADNVYVTNNSFEAPITTSPRIQRGVDAASVGDTVNVSAGTFNENVTIPKALTVDGAGAGTNPALHTIVDGASLGGSGITLGNDIANITVQDLRAQGFANGSGIKGARNNNVLIQAVHAFDNNTASSDLSGNGGIYLSGPISDVTITGSQSGNNIGRGIVIWDGDKQDITITNNTVIAANCCGIELQDGTASGVTVTGNTVTGNADSGMGFIGLQAGAGPNLIAGNTVAVSGRFGIEIKLSNGTGLASGDGSIVVENNTITGNSTPTDLRDTAGIAVYRRGYTPANVNIPTGVIVRNNSVSGFQQPSTSEGFGIVVEGVNHQVTGNTVSNNDVGVQSQGGHLPYTANSGVDGDQSNLADQFFGRGNAPIGCALNSGNIYASNGTDSRVVGTGGFIRATNLNTSETFCTIQAAINDAQTLNGHVIEVEPGVHNEAVVVNKSITLRGAGSGTTASDTILDGTSIAGHGITVANGITDVTIEDLRVRNFASGSGIHGDAGNNGLTVQNTALVTNNATNAVNGGGLYMNGPVDDVLIDGNTMSGNRSRGIVIWNGFKTNITITNNTVTNNDCCGIELQDGTASGVTATGNTVTSNADSGMAFIGLTDGAGPNLIANNIVSGTGRFGIEIKLPDGTGSDVNDGSIVVEGNTVTLSGAPANNRDLAGISVYRRDYVIGNNNVDIPTGVIVRNNTVNNYQQPSVSEGFGIVVEGVNHQVTNNTLNGNDVGVQVQGGHLPYSPNTGTNGLQDNLNDQFFGRGNAPYGCAVVSPNTFSGNTVNTRSVGNGGAGIRATNLNTSETFCTIQAAIDDAQTLNGHVIEVEPGTWEEQVEVHKAVTLEGQGEGVTTIMAPVDMTDFFSSGADNNYPIIYVHDVNATIRNITVDGAGRGNLNYRFLGVAFEQAGGTLEDVTITGMTDTPFSGNQHGNGIWGRANNGTARTLTVNDVTITNFQKNGTTFTGANLTVTMDDSTVVGSGPLGLGLAAQNGIQLSGGATGSFDNNTISNIVYVPTSYSSVGILITGSSGRPQVTNNTVLNTKNAIDFREAEGDAFDNTVSNTFANMGGTPDWWGITVLNYTAETPLTGSTTNRIAPTSPFDDGSTKEASPEAALLNREYTIARNTLTGGSGGYGVGIYALAPEATDVTVEENTIDDWAGGIDHYTNGNLVTAITANEITNSDYGIYFSGGSSTIENNRLQANTLGIWVDGGTVSPVIYENSIESTGLGVDKTAAGIAVVNASANWWGTNTPAGVAAEVSAGVDYTPWFNAGTDTDGGTAGWQGDFSWLNADDDSPQTGAVGRINEAITLVTTGGTVNLEAGTYNETTTIPKSLTLQGAGAGTDPNTHTILEGFAPVDTNGNGITIANAVTNVTIQNLRVQNFDLDGGFVAGIYGSGDNSNITISGVHLYGNNRNAPATSQGGGVHFANGTTGPAHVEITNSEAVTNTGRGFTLWIGARESVTITGNLVHDNSIVGIDLSGGTSEGVLISGNTVTENGDSGIAVSGLQGGSGANRIANNTVTDNGRFGIEVKVPTGNGTVAGDGSIVIEGNTVSRTVPIAASEQRDLAGIAVFRRDYVAGNADIPTGVIVRNNTVAGYRQTTVSDGFGIVVEGVNHQVTTNTLNNNDVGVQVQGGHLPYTPNSSVVNGDQNNLNDQFFGRGNAPYGCAAVSGNTFSGNTTNERSVGNGGAGIRATNLNTSETFCTIQAAIDDADTTTGHTIEVEPGTWEEQVEVHKAITLEGQGEGVTTIVAPVDMTKSFASPGNTNYPIIYVHDVNATIRNLTVDGAGRGNLNYRFFGVAFEQAGGTLEDVTITGMTDTPFSGSQHGNGIWARANNGTARALTVNDVTITNFQKNGTTFTGANLTVTMNDSTVTGAGPTAALAQNGIQLSGGAFGSFDNNTISNIVYTTGPDAATGYLISGAGGTVNITNSTITNTTVAIYSINTQGDITDNTIVNTSVGMTGAFYWWGAIVYNITAAPLTGEGTPALPDAFDTGVEETVTEGALLNRSYMIEGNSFTGGGGGDGISIYADAPEVATVTINENNVDDWATGVYLDGAGTLNADVTANSITNSDVGIQSERGTITITNNVLGNNTTGVLVSGGGTVSPVIYENSIESTGLGVDKTAAGIAVVNASANWWGTNTPAGVAAEVSAGVDYTPWFNAGTDTDGGTAGWQGDFSWFNADDDSPQTGAVGRINEAIALVTTGGTVNLAAGNYNETATVPKSLTLQGAGATTVLDGNTPSATTGNGITLNGGVTDVIVQDLRVQDYGGAAPGGSGIHGTLSNHNTIVRRTELVNNNLSNVANGGGLYMNGPVNNVTIDDNDAINNRSRGIVIWNGSKTNITITNNYVANNICCGIELQDGTASGITVTGNVVENNGDSGMAFIGLQGGAGPNVISGNTITNNGRFGIEIKLPDGNGTATGDGSIVIENNTVSRSAVPTDIRDLAGISVYRRGWQPGNVDIPVGVIVRNNTVSGYQQPTASDGFGIVVEGVNHQVTTNTLNNNDVGVQVQGGHLPYAPNTPTDGNQDVQGDLFFGRGNAPLGCAISTGNIFSGNTTDTRSVGNAGDSIRATNTNTLEQFCTIQSAIDDPQTLNGHTVSVAPGTWEEQVEVYKEVTLQGAGELSTIIRSPVTLTKFFVTSVNNYPVIYVRDTANVVIRDLTVDGFGRGNGNARFIGIGYRNAGGAVNNVTVKDIRETPISGAQSGVGIYAFADNGTARSLSVNNATVFGFQKNGTAFNGANLTATMSNSTVTGAGPLNFTAQNGIQLAFGATGSFSNNTISNVGYSPTSDTASGYLLYQASGTTAITGSTLEDVEAGAYAFDSALNFNGNTVTQTTAGMTGMPTWYGVFVDSAVAAPLVSDARVQPFGDSDGGDGSANAVMTRIHAINANTMTSEGRVGTAIGVDADALEVTTLNIITNTLTTWGVGIEFDGNGLVYANVDDNYIGDNDVGIVIRTGVMNIINNFITVNSVGIRYFDSDGVEPEVHGNDIDYNTSWGVEHATFETNPTIVDATGNYWGDATGPLDVSPPADAPCTTLLEYNPTSTGNPVTECVRWFVPTSVMLANFEAAARANDILVTWETASETDNLGFNLYRATTPDGTPEQLNGELIPSQAPGGGGASYEWVDVNVEVGVTYYYWLEAVDIQGNGSPYFGPVSATYGQPTAVTVSNLDAQPASMPALLAAALVLFGVVGIVIVRRKRR